MKGLTDLNTLFTTLNEIFRPSVTLSMTFYKTQIILGAFGGPVREHFGPFQAHFGPKSKNQKSGHQSPHFGPL